MRITVKDVARYAGVSPQTVSNVLNRRGKYGDGARVRVLEAVEVLGYRPSNSARTLRSTKTNQLAYHVLPDQLQARNPLLVDFLSALVSAAQARGYTITVFTTDPDTIDDFEDVIVAETADAFILSDCDRHDTRARQLAERGIPFVALGRTANDLPQCWVDIDNIAATAAMVDHLARQGHRRIAFLGRDDERYWSRDRVTGYLQGLTRNTLPVDQALVARVDGGHILDTVKQILLATPPPTAIMTDSDVLAAATINGLKALGLRQRRDIDVTGFDGGLIEHISEPPTASVHLPVAAIAAKVIERCLREISRTGNQRPGELIATTIATPPAATGGAEPTDFDRGVAP